MSLDPVAPPDRNPQRAIVNACGVLRDAEGRVLFVHRRPDRARWPDLWYLPGGEALDDEDVDDTVVRELREATGVQVREYAFLDTIFDQEPRSGRRAVHNLYLVHAYAGQPRLCAPEEHDALAWLAPGELAAHGVPAALLAVLGPALGGEAAASVAPVDMRAAWNQIAPSYQAEHAIPTDRIHYGPNVAPEDELRLVGPPGGQDVIELGCGGGQNSIAFKRQGARRVVGVDLSEVQLTHAGMLAAGQRQADRVSHQPGVEVEWHQGTVEDLSAFGDASFDIAFSASAFQFVDDLAAAFAEAFRVLRPGGRLAFCTEHPVSGMYPDGPATPSASYFQRRHESVWFTPGGGTRVVETVRTIEELFGLLRAAGFTVTAIQEPRHDPDRLGLALALRDLGRAEPRLRVAPRRIPRHTRRRG